MRRLLIAAMLAFASIVGGRAPSMAQTAAGLTYGQVPSAAQWNALFAGKADYPGILGYANTWTGPQLFAGPCSVVFITSGPCFTSPSTAETDLGPVSGAPWHRWYANIHEIDANGAVAQLRLYRLDATLANSSIVGSIPMGGYDATGTWHIWGWLTCTAVTTTAPTAGQCSILVDVNGVPTDVLDLNAASAVFHVPTQASLSGTSASFSGSPIAAGACAVPGTATVTGATTGMGLTVTPVTYPGDGISWQQSYISAANTVTIKLCNFTSGSLTPATTAYNARVQP